ncbi:MAG TPA: response regulator [Rectinemataceae bacterium]|nr:response regulator [Rectinemataceae bacterium]
MSGSRQYILLVEDDPIVSAALIRELQSWAKRRSIEILHAASSAQGLELIETYGDDIYIVIAELKMPGMSGPDFIAAAGQSHQRIVSFLLSGVPDIEAIIKSLRSNLFGLISTPWDSWNLRLDLSMAFEVAEDRRIGLRSASMGKTARELARESSHRTLTSLVHEAG